MKNTIERALEVLQKSLPRPTLPGLPKITTRPDQEVHSIGTERQAKIAAGSAVAHARQRGKEVGAKKMPKEAEGVAQEAFAQIAASKGKTGALGVNIGYNVPTGKKSHVSARSVAGAQEKVMGTHVQEHEGTHYLINEVRRNYGDGNAKGIMQHMISHFHPHDLAAISAHMFQSGYDPMHGEEVLTHARDILTEPKVRERMKESVSHAERQGVTYNPETPWFGAHAHDLKRMKKSYLSMVESMKGITEKHLNPAYMPKPAKKEAKSPKPCGACGGKLGRGKPKTIHPNMLGLDSSSPTDSVPLCTNCSKEIKNKLKTEKSLTRVEAKLEALKKAK